MADKKTDPVEEGRKLQAEAVAAQEEADKIQPTPTQEEADNMKLGKVAEKKTTKADTAEGSSGSYKTRASKSD